MIPQRADPLAFRDTIARAAELLRAGALVAFPTETVYGLGANALDAAAVRRLYEVKGRPGYNPLIVHVADAEKARTIVRVWPETARRLAEAFWPGPLTLVLPKHDVIPDNVTAGLDTIAVRVPSHPIAQALLRTADLPIAAPSANRFMGVSPTTARHVERALGDRVALVLDGGETPVGIESTVVDLSGESPSLLRPGSIPLDEIASHIGPVGAPSRTDGDSARRSPGMLARHYAPEATVVLFGPGDVQSVAGVLERAHASGRATAAIVRELPDPPVRLTIRLPSDAAGYARRLYAALHELDESGAELIVIEKVPGTPDWAGVRDRIERAAADG